MTKFFLDKFPMNSVCPLNLNPDLFNVFLHIEESAGPLLYYLKQNQMMF